MRILFVGHATFRITLGDGTVLLTDPWFSRNPLLRAVQPALAPEEVGPVHFLLGSHDHLDHIDRRSLALARRQNATVIGSTRVARRARRFGIERVIALASGEQQSFDAFTIRATPAFHPLARDAVGFLIRAEGKQLYYSGDTRPHADLILSLRETGPIDLALLQIACSRYFGRDDGLSVDTAADLALAIRPRIVIPMHHHGRFRTADPTVFCERVARGFAGISPAAADGASSDPDGGGSGIRVLALVPGEEVEPFA